MVPVYDAIGVTGRIPWTILGNSSGLFPGKIILWRISNATGRLYTLGHPLINTYILVCNELSLYLHPRPGSSSSTRLTDSTVVPSLLNGISELESGCP
jgi:hypothetical protein